MGFRNIITGGGKSRLAHAGGLLLRALLAVAMVSFSAGTAEAKTKKKTSTKSSSSSKKKGSSSKNTAKKPVSLDEVPLKASNYPAEISGRIALYNEEVSEINAVRKKDPAMAKARGEVLKIRKESFDQYGTFMASMKGGETDKIRKAVASNGWYKGMPQIAFVASQGLPDDLVSGKDSRLTLIYKSGSYHFEKGRLRSYDKVR